MSKEEKAQTIDKLQETFSRCSIGILTDYRGLTTTEMTGLRIKLREFGIEYRVVKNTLARFAAERSGRNDLAGYFEGPVAIAFGYGDIIEPAKTLASYIRSTKVSLDIKGGFISDSLLTAADIDTLSTLPSREMLIAKVLGGIQSPLAGLVNCLTAPISGLIMGLQSRIKQLEEE